MHRLAYDLHIHSCLSPCSDEDMTPANIVNMAKLTGLDVIAVTDHNSCKNCPAVFSFAQKNDIIAIPGMELCTMEEVHVLCLFPDLENAMAFDSYVYDRLIKILNNEKVFGKQEIYNEDDVKIGEEPYLLINATDITFDNLDKLMKEYDGVYIPAHVDKTSTSLISNLGFVPPDANFKCAEIKDAQKTGEMKMQHPYFNRCNIVFNSDAHSLWDINEAVNFIEVKERDAKSVLEALVGAAT
jgi:PHP domain.